jgi:hypothetical protein
MTWMGYNSAMTRKRILAFLIPIVSLALLVAYCTLPLVTVSAITLTLEDAAGGKIVGPARGRFLDADGREIVTVALGELPSWDNKLHWWAHSSHPESKLHPDDARRARSVLIEADGCAPLTLPVELGSTYAPPSLLPHGGGRAYMLYEFSAVVRLECGGS